MSYLSLGDIEDALALALFKKDFNEANKIVDEYRISSIRLNLLNIPNIKITKYVNNGIVQSYIYSDIYNKYIMIDSSTTTIYNLLAFIGNLEGLQWLYDNNFFSKFDEWINLLKFACISANTGLVKWITSIVNYNNLAEGINNIYYARNVGDEFKIYGISGSGVIKINDDYFFTIPGITDILSVIFCRSTYNNTNLFINHDDNYIHMILRSRAPYVNYNLMTNDYKPLFSDAEYLKQYESKLDELPIINYSGGIYFDEISYCIKNGAIPFMKWSLYNSKYKKDRLINFILFKIDDLDDYRTIYKSLDYIMEFLPSNEELIEMPNTYRIPFYEEVRINLNFLLCIMSVYNSKRIIVSYFVDRGLVKISDYNYYLVKYIYYNDNLSIFQLIYEKNRCEVLKKFGDYFIMGGLFESRITEWMQNNTQNRIEVFGEIFRV
jgi:hypothetical protein